MAARLHAEAELRPFVPGPSQGNAEYTGSRALRQMLFLDILGTHFTHDATTVLRGFFVLDAGLRWKRYRRQWILVFGKGSGQKLS
jgi:hypothetical protein